MPSTALPDLMTLFRHLPPGDRHHAIIAEARRRKAVSYAEQRARAAAKSDFDGWFGSEAMRERIERDARRGLSLD